jgi:hypothetical protein
MSTTVSWEICHNITTPMCVMSRHVQADWQCKGRCLPCICKPLLLAANRAFRRSSPLQHIHTYTHIYSESMRRDTPAMQQHMRDHTKEIECLSRRAQ